jgi:hypothetical protein
MRLDEKAKENLEAVERLVSTGDGRLLPLSNAAASRAYYAAYLAVADRAQRDGRGFDSARLEYYRHDTLPGNALGWSILDVELRDETAGAPMIRCGSFAWDVHRPRVFASAAGRATLGCKCMSGASTFGGATRVRDTGGC